MLGSEHLRDRQDRHGLRKHVLAVVLVAALASAVLAWAGPAQAKRMSGTSGADRIVGTAKADVIKARGSKDRINGRGGNDRLYGGPGADRLTGGPGRDLLRGGRGADRLNSVDGRRDRRVIGGPGRDHCRVDKADKAVVRGCEIVTIVGSGTSCQVRRPGPSNVSAFITTSWGIWMWLLVCRWTEAPVDRGAALRRGRTGWSAGCCRG